MNSLLVSFLASLLTPILLVFSLVLLSRGHDLPGGGFVGGLVASAGFVIQVLGHGVPRARRWLRLEPHFLAGAGLFLAIGSASVCLLSGDPFMTGVWTKVKIAGLITLKVGTPAIFDAGVYLAVVGTTLMIFFHLKEN